MMSHKNYSEKVQIAAEREIAPVVGTGAFTQIVLGTVVAYIHPLAKAHDTTVIASLVFILILNIIRFLILKNYPVAPDVFSRALWRLTGVHTSALTSLAWGVIAYKTFYTFSMTNEFSALMILIIAGICIIAMISLNAYPLTVWMFNLCTIIPSGIGIYQSKTSSAIFFLTYFGIYILYMGIQTRIQYRTFWLRHQQNYQMSQDKDEIQTIIDATPGLVTTFNCELKLINANSQFLRSYNLTDKEKIAQFNLLNDDLNPQLKNAILQFYSLKALHFALEVQLNAMDGSKKWYLVLLERILTDSKLVDDAHILMIAIDIDEQKRTTTQLEEQRVLAEQNSKLATLGEMAAGVAHEINNPLAIISGYSDELINMAEEKTLTAENSIEYLKKIYKTSFRIAKIVKGLKTVSRNAETDPFLRTNLYEIIQDTLVLCTEKFKNGNVQLKVSCTNDIYIDCRGSQISQILLNLLNNSYDAIKSLNVEDKWIRLEIEQHGDKVVIQVTDCGMGIPKEIQDKIFNPFFTTKEVGKGTGLGMSISKALVESHNGRLYIDDNCVNTRFVVELPIRNLGTIQRKAA